MQPNYVKELSNDVEISQCTFQLREHIDKSKYNLKGVYNILFCPREICVKGLALNFKSSCQWFNESVLLYFGANVLIFLIVLKCYRKLGKNLLHVNFNT